MIAAGVVGAAGASALGAPWARSALALLAMPALWGTITGVLFSLVCWRPPPNPPAGWCPPTWQFAAMRLSVGVALVTVAAAFDPRLAGVLAIVGPVVGAIMFGIALRASLLGQSA